VVVQILCDDEVQDGVTEEFEPFIGANGALDARQKGTMQQRLDKDVLIADRHADQALEFLDIAAEELFLRCFLVVGVFPPGSTGQLPEELLYPTHSGLMSCTS
jgi:hypothetical protein